MAKSQNVTTGRLAEQEGVAALIAFLLSGVAGNITGADYIIDGGTLKALWTGSIADEIQVPRREA